MHRKTKISEPRRICLLPILKLKQKLTKHKRRTLREQKAAEKRSKSIRFYRTQSVVEEMRIEFEKYLKLEEKYLELEKENLGLEEENLDLEKKNLELEKKENLEQEKNLQLEEENLELEKKNLELEEKEDLELEKKNPEKKELLDLKSTQIKYSSPPVKPVLYLKYSNNQENSKGKTLNDTKLGMQ